jgi:Phytoene dehydrogenase and related proteins
MGSDYDAVVLGSGPNGLAAAITLAQAGCAVLVLEANQTIGGGARSAELTVPGFLHDVCSAVHPLAVASPFFKSLPLERFGLKWIHPEMPLAHPIDGDDAVCLHRDLAATAASLGSDGEAYRNLMQPFEHNWRSLTPEVLQPLLHLPRHPFALARFGLNALLPTTVLARIRFKQEAARALFAGLAAHSFLPLESVASSAVGLVLGTAGHCAGWPIPRGGSQSITNALAAHFRELGGVIETGRLCDSLVDLPKCRALLLDVTVWQFLGLAGNQLRRRYRKKLARFRHAPGIFKIDYALNSPVPWKNSLCAKAGTVHLGGTLEEIAAGERAVAAGEHPQRPFVLIAQQSLFDETRAPRGRHTLWAYCHVPFGSDRDMSEPIERQIERFAPGFRDCIIARRTSAAADLEKSNRNLAGGEINGGAVTLWQMVARPVFSPTPYRTALPGVYLCSSSTPPGGGVHGMCGYHAARAALRDLVGKPHGGAATAARR